MEWNIFLLSKQNGLVDPIFYFPVWGIKRKFISIPLCGIMYVWIKWKMSSQPSVPFKQKCFGSLVKWKTVPPKNTRVHGGRRTDVHSTACIDGTPLRWWNGSETSTGLLTVFVRWEMQSFPRQKLLFTKIVWQIFTANSIFAKTWLNYSCWVYITLQDSYSVSQEIIILPHSQCSLHQCEGRWRAVGSPAFTVSIMLLPGLLI